ncbi:MAG: protein phosphatase 2C domain-containing protein [Gammaproteobacteria bacterium]
METETSLVSRIGNRESNQDRAAVSRKNGVTLLVVADGMGGHADGAAAAQAAVDAVEGAFTGRGDPAKFLADALQAAHEAAVALGVGVAIELRPRTTCVAAVVTKGTAWWAHVGDSRAYLVRAGTTEIRTRDHSHVEALIQAGEISEAESRSHPLRNLVDRCIGGEPEPVEVDVHGPVELAVDDLLLLCSDGFWDGLKISAAAQLLVEAPSLDVALESLADDACAAAAPYSDNATAAALRVRG